MPFNIEHWMMFGTFAEQRHFIYPSKETYDGVIINGNMAAHAPDGLGAFLLEKTTNLKYIIDPLMHAFQHDPYFISDGDGEPKTSIKAIAEAYGAPVSTTVGKRPVLPKDFESDDILRELVRNCLGFQNDILSTAMSSSDAMKYIEDGEGNLRPYALVAPYFYITETTVDRWLKVAVRAAEIAKEEFPNAKIFSSIVVSQGVILDKSKREQIQEEFEKVAIDGYLFWVDNLNEVEAAEEELKGMVALARALRADGKREVINLHGGYFSVLAAGVLGAGAFSGVTHGPEFGECRSVVPVGGGIPIARYYIPQLHSRIRYRDALRFLKTKGWLENVKDFFENVCDCSECKVTLGTDTENFIEFGKGKVKDVKRGKGFVRIEYPTIETKLHCLRHYLNRKNVEYKFASTASAQQIVDDLQQGREAFEAVVGVDGVDHLLRWQQVLRGKRK